MIAADGRRPLSDYEGFKGGYTPEGEVKYIWAPPCGPPQARVPVAAAVEKIAPRGRMGPEIVDMAMANAMAKAIL